MLDAHTIEDRRRASDEAVHSIEMEGFEFTTDELACFEAWAQGEISLDEIVEKYGS